MSDLYDVNLKWALDNITSANSDIRLRAGALLRQAADIGVLTELCNKIWSANEFARVEIVRLLAHHNAALDERLRLATSDASEYVRKASILSLDGESPKICQVLVEALGDPTERVRVAAMIMLINNSWCEAAGAIQARLSSSSWVERWWCCYSLYRLERITHSLKDAVRELNSSDESAAFDADVRGRREIEAKLNLEPAEHVLPTTDELLLWIEAKLDE